MKVKQNRWTSINYEVKRPPIRDAYRALDKAAKRHAKKSYRLWSENPFYPSLHFKCINAEEDVWSIRISRGYRALGVMEGDTVTWFWVGSHKDYERFFS